MNTPKLAAEMQWVPPHMVDRFLMEVRRLLQDARLPMVSLPNKLQSEAFFKGPRGRPSPNEMKAFIDFYCGPLQKAPPGFKEWWLSFKRAEDRSVGVDGEGHRLRAERQAELLKDRDAEIESLAGRLAASTKTTMDLRKQLEDQPSAFAAEIVKLRAQVVELEDADRVLRADLSAAEVLGEEQAARAEAAEADNARLRAELEAARLAPRGRESAVGSAEMKALKALAELGYAGLSKQ